jgi:hypothetical protein
MCKAGREVFTPDVVQHAIDRRFYLLIKSEPLKIASIFKTREFFKERAERLVQR